MNLYESLSKGEKFLNMRRQSPAYIPVIAEIGINHNGDMEIAKKLVSVAKEAGCDAVKFQKRDVNTVYSAEVLDSPRESPWGNTQRAQKEGLEFGEEEYKEIASFCSQIGIDWSASAWDLESLAFIEKFNPPFHKIASAMITHDEFVSEVAKLGRPTLISTGMTTMDRIEEVVGLFKNERTPFVLMHTVSTYPTPQSDLNLGLVPALFEKLGVPVGYSGHESSVSPSIVAASLGAVIIERHITLDRTMYGSDQAASLEPAGLKTLVGALRKLPESIGSGQKDLAPGEQEIADKLRYW